MNMRKPYKPRDEKLTATSFEKLPDSEKDRILGEIEAQTPEQRLASSRPLTPKEKMDWDAFVRKANRSRTAKSKEQNVSIRLEQSLLEKADAYAKRHKLNRSELFARSLKRLIKSA